MHESPIKLIEPGSARMYRILRPRSTPKPPQIQQIRSIQSVDPCRPALLGLHQPPTGLCVAYKPAAPPDTDYGLEKLLRRK